MYYIDIREFRNKDIHDLGKDFSGTDCKGNSFSFTNYYMKKNELPFFGISGELHFSRMDETRWNDELAKMKMGGINVVSTYVFWNHHEEEEGIFDFSGRRDIRKFVELCSENGLYVILRIGPFDHGEVRNGGLPDWLYGKPFEVRSTNPGFLECTKKIYAKIGEQVKGLFFKDGGPIIGVQLDNEYMHSSAPWEITTGISNEWVFGGNEGNAYMLALKALAKETGIEPVFYTCTGWGGAATPDSFVPLWGGYAYQPWLFYTPRKEHPSTPEYLYQDLHNNDRPRSYNFVPQYMPEDRPYSCCEMGGGMMCSYYYRFIYPYKSVDAMANIKLASGCNFLGYYMFHGGTNPLGKHGGFMNEGQVTKVSYDYQACIGEFGQVRESYLRLKSLHYFANTLGDRLCNLKTILPEGASEIDPKDLDTLRFAVRTDGHRGFLFLNNFQDHEVMHEKKEETVVIDLPGEKMTFTDIGLKTDENCMLPFHFDLGGIDLIKATAQPVAKIVIDGTETYVFLKPDGMKSYFEFDESTSPALINCEPDKEFEEYVITGNGKKVKIVCVSRELSNHMYIPSLAGIPAEGLIFSEASVFARNGSLFVEGEKAEGEIMCYPETMPVKKSYACEEKHITPEIEKVGNSRYIINLPKNFYEGKDVKDVMLRITYQGDIGHAFIDGKMINDNFYNGAPWEIGLKEHLPELESKPITIYITPLKKGVNVNVESAMAGRMEEVKLAVGELQSVEVVPIYEHKI